MTLRLVGKMSDRLVESRQEFSALLFQGYPNKCSPFQKSASLIACEPKPNYCVWIRFDDGLAGVVDLKHLLRQETYKRLESIDFFWKVHVDPKSDSLAWGDDIQLDPNVLRDMLSE